MNSDQNGGKRSLNEAMQGTASAWECKDSKRNFISKFNPEGNKDLPMDFSCLRGSTGAPSTAHAPPAASTLPTFNDIRTAAQHPRVNDEASNHANELHIQSLQNLPKAPSLSALQGIHPPRLSVTLPDDPKTKDPGPLSSSRSLPLTAAAPQTLLEVPEMTFFDWALKKSLRVQALSESPMASSFTRVTRLTPQQVTLAQSLFLGLPLPSPPLSPLPLEVRVHSALMTWRHPEATWSQEEIKALMATATTAQVPPTPQPHLQTSGPALLPKGGLLSSRLASWRLALRSLYLDLRLGQCPCFYLVVPQAAPSSSSSSSSVGGGQVMMTVVFSSIGTRGRPHPHATLSQSTSTMRARLVEAGVEFILPLAPREEDERVRQQAVRLRRVTDEEEDRSRGVLAPLPPPSSSSSLKHWTSARDMSPESMVLIEGHQGVHLLLDLILNEASSYQPAPGHFFLGPGGAMGIGLGGGGVSDLPLILAPTPFHGASVHKPQIRLRSSSSFFISSSSTNSLGSSNLTAANLPRQASSLLDLERQALEGQEDDQGPLRDEGGLRMRRGGEGLGRGSNGSVNEVWSGLEVTGPLPPWTLHRLLRVLQEEGGEEGGGSRGLQNKRLKRQVFQMRMESEASCINLNCLPLQRRQGEGGEEDRGVGGAEMERDDGLAEERAIKDEGALIHRRFVKGITSKGDGGLIMNL